MTDNIIGDHFGSAVRRRSADRKKTFDITNKTAGARGFTTWAGDLVMIEPGQTARVTLDGDLGAVESAWRDAGEIEVVSVGA
jgi:hypothetical protein